MTQAPTNERLREQAESYAAADTAHRGPRNAEIGDDDLLKALHHRGNLMETAPTDAYVMLAAERRITELLSLRTRPAVEGEGAQAMLDKILATPPEPPLGWFGENVDSWGADKWFDRLARAIRNHDKAIVADDPQAETFQMIASSSAFRLVRDFEPIVRAALELSPPGSKTDDGWVEWHGRGRPVFEDDRVFIRQRGGSELAVIAGTVKWSHDGRAHDIIAYRVVTSPGVTNG